MTTPVKTTEMPVAEFRSFLADATNRVIYLKDRVVLTRHGRPVAALIPIDDFDFLAERLPRRGAAA